MSVPRVTPDSFPVMSAADAEEYTQSLGQVVAGGYRQVALGVRLGVPSALGISTPEWVERRLGGYVRMSIPERREAVSELVAEGMTQREAADVLGVDHATVHRDLRGASAPLDTAPEAPRDDSRGADAPPTLDFIEAEETEPAAAFSAAFSAALLKLDPPCFILQTFTWCPKSHARKVRPSFSPTPGSPQARRPALRA